MRNPRQLPEPLASAPFLLSEAQLRGIPRGRLRGRDLLVPSRGIRDHSVPDGPEPDLAALAGPLSRVSAFSAASHATAFRLWGFPGFLPGADDGGIHLSRPDGMAIPRRRGVTGHRGQFFPDEITELHGVLITTRVRTWLDVARLMPVDELTAAADFLLRMPRPEFEGRSAPFASKADLDRMLERHWGTPGIRKARLALDLARVGADSAPETKLRLAVGRAGLPEPAVNLKTELLPGVTRQPDLSFPEYRVAVEYEGSGHSEAPQVDRDIGREEDYGRASWIQVRISHRHMADDARAAVRKIAAALGSRGWRRTGSQVTQL
ncbi:MAG: hypothetical protein ACHP7K_06225 [Actinomycetales bacterium]